ncbi:MAG: AI-2E family transporter [bacterium]|nr:AI-2E family transporter [bacterium]
METGKNGKVQLEVSWSSLWRVVFVFLIAYFFYLAKDIVLAVLLSIVISSALDPLISGLEKRRIPRVLSTLGIFIILILLIAILLYIILPVTLTEINVFIETMAGADIPVLGLEKLTEASSAFSESIGRLASVLFSGGASLFDTLSKFLGGISLFIMSFVLSFYLTVDRDGVEKLLRAVLPPSYEEQILSIYFRTRYKIGKWLEGQILLSLSVGVAVFIGLSLLGVKYSLVLAILAAVLELVPFVGPIIGGAIAVLFALSQSQAIAIYVLIFFVVVQKLEGTLLVPTFMRLTTSLNPAVVLIAILLGGQLAGIIGFILAVPGAVLVQEVINHWSEVKMKNRLKVEQPTS